MKAISQSYLGWKVYNHSHSQRGEKIGHFVSLFVDSLLFMTGNTDAINMFPPVE